MNRIYTTVNFSYYNNQQYLRNSIAGFMKIILEEVQKVADIYQSGAIANTGYKKYNLLSVNDSAITSMLMAAKIYDVNCLLDAFEKNKYNPDFSDNCENYPMLSSSVIFELVLLTPKGSTNKQLRIRFNYNGKYIDFCGLNNTSENFSCDIKTFDKKITDMSIRKLNKDYFLADGISNNDKDFKLIYKFSLVVLLLLLILMVQILVMKNKKIYNEKVLFERVTIDFGETD